MFRSRFLWKIFLGYILVIAVATLFAQIYVSRRVSSDAMAELQNSLRARCFLLREIVIPTLAQGPEDESTAALRALVDELGEELDTRFTVIAADGTVLADSRETTAHMDSHGSRPEILDARQNDFGVAVRFSDTMGRRMMYVALPVRQAGDLLGYVRSSLSLAQVESRLGALNRTINLGALLAAALALAIGLALARQLSRPLGEITAAARAMSGGGVHERLLIRGNDEVAELARAFDGMASHLSERLESLTAERNKLEAILAGMVEGVIAVNREERILHINGVAAGLLGVSALKSVGKPIWEVTRIPALTEGVNDCLSRRSVVNMEIRQTTIAGERIIELYGSPLPGGGTMAGAVIVLHDVTELRRLETLRRDFVANVSHELKTPLTAIRGLVETLEDDREMSEPTRTRFLAKIRKQTESLSAQVADLLSLSRLEASLQQPDDERFDLREAAQEAAQLLEGSAQAKGVRLLTLIGEEPISIRGDRSALAQAIGNLLDNAIKYTHAGGQVSLDVRSDDREARVTVEDTGIGIEPRHHERIFERFYRVDRARSRELGGTGLGLAIVKHAVQRHGGRITLHSQPGRGTRFSIQLPVIR